MTTQERHSKIINSVMFCQFTSFSYEEFRTLLQTYCSMMKYKGKLLDTYNKTFQLNKPALIEYVCFEMPKKYLIDFWNNINQ